MHDSAEERPVWAWIDLEALRHNARRAIECAAGRAVIGVVKADGYGHGASEIARGLLAEGVSRLAVVSVAEGASLRRAGIMAPILLMGGLDDRASAERALKWGLTPVIHDRAGFELACGIARASAPLAVEVEIDTGMHRMGVAPDAAEDLLARIQASPQLTLSGIYSHLARADESALEPSREQATRFARLSKGAALGSPAPGLHLVNSAGLLRRAEIEVPETGLVTQAVRPGLMLYGVSPFTDRTAADLDLEPVLTLAARVVAIRTVEKGAGVGYGGEWRAPRRTRVATLPLGYADGIPRAVLGRGEVVLGGARRPIVGRVSMDYLGVEIGPEGSEVPIEVGSVATLFGRTAEGERVPVEDLALAAGTIGYEMLTSVGNRVPRRVASGPPLPGDPKPLDPAV